MILLIPDARTEADKKTTAFKFHYDSINSISKAIHPTAKADLNSIMILLIQLSELILQMLIQI